MIEYIKSRLASNEAAKDARHNHPQLKGEDVDVAPREDRPLVINSITEQQSHEPRQEQEFFYSNSRNRMSYIRPARPKVRTGRGGYDKFSLDDDYQDEEYITCLLYTSPSPRDQRGSRMPSSA